MDTPGPGTSATPRTLDPTTLPAGRYRIDPQRTTVRARMRHLYGLGVVHAEVALRTGQIVIEETVDSAFVRVVLDAASFGTGNPARDRDVMSAKYLDVSAFPDITFESSRLSWVDSGWMVAGTLNAHGVSAQTTLAVDELREADGEMRIRAHTTIDRYAHGVTAGKGMAGRWLTVDVMAVARRQLVNER